MEPVRFGLVRRVRRGDDDGEAVPTVAGGWHTFYPAFAATVGAKGRPRGTARRRRNGHRALRRAAEGVIKL